MVALGVIGLFATLGVRFWGDPLSRVDETIVMVVTVLVVGLSPIVEWLFRFAFAGVSTLSERLAAANEEIDRLSEETARLRGALHIEDFGAEAEEFGTLAASFWLKLERAFDRYVIAQHPNKTRTLYEIAGSAPWPDMAAPGMDGSAPPHRILRAFASSVYPPYGFELIPRERFDGFDAVRRNLRRRIRQWGERLNADQREEVAAWLGAQIRPAHSSTIKLAWYLEISSAERTGVSGASDFAYFGAVRDALEASGNELEARVPQRATPDSMSSRPSLRSSKARNGGVDHQR